MKAVGEPVDGVLVHQRVGADSGERGVSEQDRFGERVRVACAHRRRVARHGGGGPWV